MESNCKGAGWIKRAWEGVKDEQNKNEQENWEGPILVLILWRKIQGSEQQDVAR